MTLRERAKRYATEFWDALNDGKGERFRDTTRDYESGFREAIALAAEKADERGQMEYDIALERTEAVCALFETGDEIRALAESETPPGACL